MIIFMRVFCRCRAVVSQINDLESALLSDPFAVYFGPPVQTSLQMPYVPCSIINADKVN